LPWQKTTNNFPVFKKALRQALSKIVNVITPAINIKLIICILFFTRCYQNSFSQINLKSDIITIISKNHKISIDSLNSKKVMVIEKNRKLNRFNPVYAFLKGSMFVYQRVLSPQLNASCVFEQSCSNFSKSAIKKFGIIKGVLLSADRITRCLPSTPFDSELHLVNESGKVIDPIDCYQRNVK